MISESHWDSLVDGRVPSYSKQSVCGAFWLPKWNAACNLHAGIWPIGPRVIARLPGSGKSAEYLNYAHMLFLVVFAGHHVYTTTGE